MVVAKTVVAFADVVDRLAVALAAVVDKLVVVLYSTEDKLEEDVVLVEALVVEVVAFRPN